MRLADDYELVRRHADDALRDLVARHGDLDPRDSRDLTLVRRDVLARLGGAGGRIAASVFLHATLEVMRERWHYPAPRPRPPW